MKNLRRLWISLDLILLILIQNNCFGQVAIQHTDDHERSDDYRKAIIEERWSEALEILQGFNKDELPAYIVQLVRLQIMKSEYEEATRLIESNEEAFSDAWSLWSLGAWYVDRSPSKSRRFITKSLDIDASPEAAQCAIVLGYRQRDIKYIVESLRKLYKRHPSQMGGYSPEPAFPIEEADERFGSEQVEIVCKDRPHLASLISPRLSEWLTKRFSGAFIGRRAAWSPIRPQGLESGVGACHLPASGISECVIWVNPELDGEAQLAALVFELLNAENSSESNLLWGKAAKGLIDRDGYVREVAKQEHIALLKRRAFFTVEYFAGGLAEDSAAEPWYLHVPMEFEAYFKSQPLSVNEYYATCYDSLHPPAARAHVGKQRDD